MAFLIGQVPGYQRRDSRNRLTFSDPALIPLEADFESLSSGDGSERELAYWLRDMARDQITGPAPLHHSRS